MSKHANKLKVYAMADLHGHLGKYAPRGDADIVIIAGDFSLAEEKGNKDKKHREEDEKRMQKKVLEWVNGEFRDWCGKWGRPAHPADVIIVPGNHDRFLHRFFEDVKLPENVRFLVDNEINVRGLRIYGTPWCKSRHPYKELGSQIFETSDGVLEMLFANIPDNGLDILISHMPPYSEGHARFNDSKCSKVLSERLAKMKRPPKFVLCGHVHNERNQKPATVVIGNSVKVVNVSRSVYSVEPRA